MTNALTSVVLMAIFPILALVGANIDEVIFADIFLPLSLSLFISTFVYLILSKAIKSQNKSALFIAVSYTHLTLPTKA